MDAEIIDMLLTAAAAWTLFATAGLGVVVLPWTAAEAAESADAMGALVTVLNPASTTVEDCLSPRIVVG